EGIVEIREDHVEETPNEDKATTAGEDDFARILSRMEELEKEELENEELESEVAEEGEDLDTADLSHLMSRTSFETEVRSSEFPAIHHHLLPPLPAIHHQVPANF
nr:RNA polymerase II subunit 5-mediating protein homolog isoform X2 [Tanacetum cinerariifolium]